MKDLFEFIVLIALLNLSAAASKVIPADWTWAKSAPLLSTATLKSSAISPKSEAKSFNNWDNLNPKTKGSWSVSSVFNPKYILGEFNKKSPLLSILTVPPEDILTASLPKRKVVSSLEFKVTRPESIIICLPS